MSLRAVKGLKTQSKVTATLEEDWNTELEEGPCHRPEERIRMKAWAFRSRLYRIKCYQKFKGVCHQFKSWAHIL